MKTKNLFKIVIVLCFFSFSASAQLKIDVLAGVGDALGAAEAMAQKFETKINSAFKKVLEFREKVVGELQELKAQIEEVVGEVKERVDEAKELVAEGQQLYEDSKGMYEEAKSVVDTGKEVASSIDLKRKADELQEKMVSRKSVLTEELNAKFKASKTNEQTYEQLYALAETQDEKDILDEKLRNAKGVSDNLKKNIDDASKEDTTYFEADEEYAKLQEEYEETIAELNDVLETLKQKSQSIGSNFASRVAKMSAADRKKVYSGLISDVFVDAKTKLDAQTTKKVKKARQKRLIQSAANSFALMTEHQKQSQKFDKDNDKSVADCEKSDALMTKMQIVNELNINKNNLLFDNLNTNAGLIELKSATDLLHQDYKLGNPDKNPAEIDLDSYILKEEDLKEYGLGKAE